ncbi:hypothetical protein T492DRAFT_844226 [Pavlovales sp. CCMP2436]|nr:hypothetical protein T492DRAFT_844226 [Pavlovales sp. CCMP2436]
MRAVSGSITTLLQDGWLADVLEPPASAQPRRTTVAGYGRATVLSSIGVPRSIEVPSTATSSAQQQQPPAGAHQLPTAAAHSKPPLAAAETLTGSPSRIAADSAVTAATAAAECSRRYAGSPCLPTSWTLRALPTATVVAGVAIVKAEPTTGEMRLETAVPAVVAVAAKGSAAVLAAAARATLVMGSAVGKQPTLPFVKPERVEPSAAARTVAGSEREAWGREREVTRTACHKIVFMISNKHKHTN